MARTVELLEVFAEAWQAAWLFENTDSASHELRFDDGCTALIFDLEFPLPDHPITEIECGSRGEICGENCGEGVRHTVGASAAAASADSHAAK